MPRSGSVRDLIDKMDSPKDQKPPPLPQKKKVQSIIVGLVDYMYYVVFIYSNVFPRMTIDDSLVS